MSQVMITRNTLAYRKRHTEARSFAFKPFLIMVSMGLVISFMSVMMLVHFNQVSTKGYTIKYLEVKQQELWDENELIKKDLLEMKALTSLGESEKAKSMIRPGEPIYVKVNSAIASNTN